MPFLVFALPRSRTFWLSRFLTHGDWSCGHEELRHARSIEDVRTWFRQPCIGTVETTAAPWWRLMDQVAPGARIVTIRRPVPEVIDSLARLGWPTDHLPSLAAAMGRMDRKLDQIERRLPNVLSVKFADLADEAACASVFEYCLSEPHDASWWRQLAPLNLQIDMRALLRYYEAYQEPLVKLARIAKHQTIAGLSQGRGEIEGVTIQQEPFESFLRDGVPLFAEHLIEVGEAPGDYMAKNIPLMRVLESIGAMQITTARSNGRMFGYLMTIISPSLESPSIISATNTTFYASRLFPGLGLKLQRASLAALRQRGVTEVLMRAGTRGSGRKMSSLYRRLGAEFCGESYLLNLKGA